MLSAYRSAIHSIARSNLVRDGSPYKLTLAVTYRCNFRCNMCNIWKKRPKGELSAAEIERFLRSYDRFVWVDVTGGEIFLRKDIAEIFDAVLAHCPNLLLLHFPTNGYQTRRIVSVVEGIVPRLAHRRLAITVSLDGGPEAHDRIRGIPGSWSRCLDTFERLQGLRHVDVSLGMTLTKDNLGEFERALAAARERCPEITSDSFHLNTFNESSHYYDNAGLGLAGSEEEMREAVELVRTHRKLGLHPKSLLEQAYLVLAQRFLRTGKTPLPCRSLSASVFVDPFGNVLPCVTYDRVVGNLREHAYELDSILRTDTAARLRREIRSLQCPNCWTPCEAYQTILGNACASIGAVASASLLGLRTSMRG